MNAEQRSAAYFCEKEKGKLSDAQIRDILTPRLFRDDKLRAHIENLIRHKNL